MKKIIVILTALLVISCRPMNAEQRFRYKQALYMKYVDTVCLRGVVYYADNHSITVTAPAYNQDGSLILCINEEEMKQEGAQ